MTITDKLNQILEIKNEMKTSLENKGSDINNNTLFSEYSQKILDLPTADTIKVPFMPQMFFELRTSNFTNFEYLFKDYKGEFIDVSYLYDYSFFYNGMYQAPSFKGMFHDCVNAKTLNLYGAKFSESADTTEMFNNVPVLIRVMMNYSDYTSIQKVLDALPDHTGAAEGDYRFEISTPITLFDEVTGICGTMYRGWTITKKTQEQEAIEEEEANDTTLRLSMLRPSSNNDCFSYDCSDFFVDNDYVSRPIFFDDYKVIEYFDEEGYSIENRYVNKNYLTGNGGTDWLRLTFRNVKKLLRAQELCSLIQKNVWFYIKNYENSFVFKDFVGDYDCSNLSEIHFCNYNNSDPVTVVFEGDQIKNLLSLCAQGRSVIASTSLPLDPKDTLIIRNSVCNNLSTFYCLSFKNVLISNVEFKTLETFKLAFSNSFMDYCFDTSFSPCQFESIVFDNVKAPNARDFSYMFEDNSKSLTHIDLSGLTIAQSGSIDFECMFWGCQSLKEIDLSHFNLTNIEYIDVFCMFYGCYDLEKINLSNINPASVTTTGPSSALNYCSKLNTVVMANCPWYFIEHVMTENEGLSSTGTLYCDMDMSSILPSGWIWKHSSEYTG